MARNMTARFLILASLLAVLSTAAYFAVQRLISDQEDIAHLVNISGGQLLHAQRIAASAVALVGSERPEDRTASVRLLRNSLDVMRNSHSLLTAGHGPLGKLFRGSHKLQRLYYERPYHLDMKVRKYLQDAENLLAADSEQARDVYTGNILRLSRGNLTEGLARAIKEYQDEIGARLDLLQFVRLGILAAIYVLLAMVGLLVVRPLLRGLWSREERIVELRREMEESATLDPLTDVHNRRAFEELLLREAAFARRYGNPLSALLVNLSGLGRVNRERGTASGDRLLQETAQLIGNNLRATDYVCRYDGGRFAVLAPSTGEQGAAALARKIEALIGGNRFHDGLRADAAVHAVTLSDGEDARQMQARLEGADG